MSWDCMIYICFTCTRFDQQNQLERNSTLFCHCLIIEDIIGPILHKRHYNKGSTNDSTDFPHCVPFCPKCWKKDHNHGPTKLPSDCTSQDFALSVKLCQKNHVIMTDKSMFWAAKFQCLNVLQCTACPMRNGLIKCNLKSKEAVNGDILFVRIFQTKRNLFL